MIGVIARDGKTVCSDTGQALGIRAGDIDNVVLAGGATRSPVVRQMVTRMFGRFPAMDINPDEVVALGAAVMAGLKARDVALGEVVMTDVCPYTLGVETVHRMPGGGEVDGYFSPIVERNTRAMRCQDKELLSRKNDTLMTCLRAERAAALGAGRSEDALRCLLRKAKNP